MFANRFTAFVDACTLAGTLRRNLLLSLAEAEFFRLRWSKEVLSETERAIALILRNRGDAAADEKATKARQAMADAFEDAIVTDYDRFLCVGDDLPDQNDKHVLAAALKTQAAVIVTENLKDFPSAVVATLNIEVRSADAFLANTIALDPGRAVAAVRNMRVRLKKPEKTADRLLLDMEADGLTETSDVLRPYVDSL